MWGRAEVDGQHSIHRSDDDGETWSHHVDTPIDPDRHILPTDDGEVLIASADSIYKSSGWDSDETTSVSWTSVFSLDDDGTVIRRWSIDGDGTKFVVNHYAGGGSRPDSRHVWISTDAGDTWSEVYDSVERHPDHHEDMHHHGCAYDPWADRFWTIDGHTDAGGIFYSDDDGDTWYRLQHFDNPLEERDQITTILAGRHGMVLGSDNQSSPGIYAIHRAEDPENMVLKYIWNWPAKAEGMPGIALLSRRDDQTGTVYVGFSAYEVTGGEFTETGAIIAASDGTTGAGVWEESDPADE
ncbi:WD40/YVTN/BNR-like repeat-containing protein [Natronoarchaeum sp. GCM10025703]|uniref:WD40/YVTN/BNR-like repeat-containing protein n=1 Tax=Natronoarchaeum sp. GCM10025703 TaxID=3252685 RepID=UPI0036123618